MSKIEELFALRFVSTFRIVIDLRPTQGCEIVTICLMDVRLLVEHVKHLFLRTKGGHISALFHCHLVLA